jgi:hypothetical protein
VVMCSRMSTRKTDKYSLTITVTSTFHPLSLSSSVEAALLHYLFCHNRRRAFAEILASGCAKTRKAREPH